MDPAKILERRQEQERRRIERSREWREQQAKEKLKELFKEEGMGRKLEIAPHIRTAMSQWGSWASRPQFWANLSVTPFCKLVGIGSGQDMPDINLDPQSMMIHKAVLRMRCKITQCVLVGYYVAGVSWDDNEALYQRYGISRKDFYEILRNGSIATFNAAKL